MSLKSDIVMGGSEVDIEGDAVGVRSIGGDRQFVLDPRSGLFTARSDAGNDRVLVDGENGRLSLHEDDGDVVRSTIEFSSGLAYGRFGNEEIPGSIRVKDGIDGTAIHMDGTAPEISLSRPREIENTIELDGRTGTVSVGGGSADVPAAGGVEVMNGPDTVTVEIDGSHPSQRFYEEGEETITISGNLAMMQMGNEKIPGFIELFSNVYNSGDRSRIRLNGKGGNLSMLRESEDGSKKTTVQLTDQGWFSLGGDEGEIDGEMRMTDNEGATRVQILGGRATGKANNGVGDSARVFVDGKEGLLSLGENGTSGRIKVLDSDGLGAVLTPQSLSVGTGYPNDGGYPGMVRVGSDNGVGVCILQGSDGSLTLGGGSTGTEKGDPAIEGENGLVELRTDDGKLSGSIEATPDGLLFRGPDGSSAMLIENNGVVKINNLVQ